MQNFTDTPNCTAVCRHGPGDSAQPAGKHSQLLVRCYLTLLIAQPLRHVWEAGLSLEE